MSVRWLRVERARRHGDHKAARIAVRHGGQIGGDVMQQEGRLQDATRFAVTYDLTSIGLVPLYQLDHPDLQSAFAELRTNRAVAHNLPASLTSLVGRDAETAEVSALLDDHRLVTLLGEGGCGKTRLALRVGAAGLSRFVDGVWFIDLAALRPGADSTSRVAQTLGVEGGLEELVAALDQMNVLLVLDNCEHVVESTATLVATLLVECSTTKVVATSRVALNLAGEVCYLVPPLRYLGVASTAQRSGDRGRFHHTCPGPSATSSANGTSGDRQLCTRSRVSVGHELRRGCEE
jgi:hypothetical protein